MTQNVGSALVFGVNVAESQSPLIHAESDACAVAGQLWQRGFDVFGSGAHCGVSSKEMHHIFDRFLASRQPRDGALIVFIGHGCEKGDDLWLMGSEMPASSHHFSAADVLRRLVDEKIQGALIVHACRTPGGNASDVIRKIIKPANGIAFASSCSGGQAPRDGIDGSSSFILGASQRLSEADGEHLFDFLRVIFEVTGPHLSPDVILSSGRGKQPFVIPKSSKERNMQLADVATGKDLASWRNSRGMSTETLAEAICRRKESIEAWESAIDNVNKLALPRQVVRALDAYFGPAKMFENVNDKESIVWDNFNDEREGSADFNIAEAFLPKINAETAGMNCSLDRIVWTDIRTAVNRRGEGAMYLASNQSVKGCEVGDRVVLRIVQNFHSRRRDREFMQSNDKDSRHEYRWHDKPSGRKFWVSAKAVPRPNDDESDHFVLGITSNVHVSGLFQGATRSVAAKVREHLSRHDFLDY